MSKSIQELLKLNILVKDEEIIYPKENDDIVMIFVDSVPTHISMIEDTEENGYIGFDPDDNEYVLDNYNLYIYSLRKDL